MIFQKVVICVQNVKCSFVKIVNCLNMREEGVIRILWRILGIGRDVLNVMFLSKGPRVAIIWFADVLINFAMFVFLIGMINIIIARPMPSSEQSNNFYIQALCMVTPSLHSSSCRSPYDTFISCLFSCLTCYMGLGNRIRSNSRFLLWSCNDGSQLRKLQ